MTTAVPATVSPEFERGLAYLMSLQREEGCVVGEVVWCPVITAQYVMVSFMTGREIPGDRRARFLRHFDLWQTLDGGWGLHAESPAYMFVTSMVYVALRLLDRSPDDEVCRRARVWLKTHGGVERSPSWGKLWLAMMNLYAYEGLQPVLPELWLLPRWFPLHPGRMYCHTRMIYLGFGHLYGVRFQVPVSPLIEKLRRELYDRPYGSIDFTRYRDDIAAPDLYAPPNRLVKLLYRASASFERRNRRPLRGRALGRTLELIVAHQEQSNFAAVSPVNGLLNILALYHAGHPAFEPSFHGVDYWTWKDQEGGERFNGAHSHTWDTSFAVQAICEGLAGNEALPFLQRAAGYLREVQMREELPGLRDLYRDRLLGGFCFSDQHHRWPVSDCTGEALSAICYLYDRVEAQERIEARMLVEAVRFVLSRQNSDGGWGSYERRRRSLFEPLNSTEMFGNCMVERSYVECTGSCLQGLRHVLDRFAELLPARDLWNARGAVHRGALFLRRTQLPDGSWPGFWGINYTYGTLFGVVGLLASGTADDAAAVERACRWVVAARLPGGGWGESWYGCFAGRPIPHQRSQIIMTSWALIALLKAAYAGPGAREAIDAGVQLLRERQLSDGNWPQEAVAGVFFNTAMHHYCLYKNYFPLWALGLYDRLAGSQGLPPAQGL